MRALQALLLLFALGMAFGQLKQREAPPEQFPDGLIDEDEDLFLEKQYAFNPIQAKKEVKVGKFYAKKGNHRAAAGRYLEATRWNPNFSDAYWRLAQSRDKLKQASLALEAYRKFVRLESAGKRVGEAVARIAVLEPEVKAAVSPGPVSLDPVSPDTVSPDTVSPDNAP
jgi:tetratricopeptide (TPR) repeat protein